MPQALKINNKISLIFVDLLIKKNSHIFFAIIVLNTNKPKPTPKTNPLLNDCGGGISEYTSLFNIHSLYCKLYKCIHLI